MSFLNEGRDRLARNANISKASVALRHFPKPPKGTQIMTENLSPLWTALRHVVNHVTYHQGQVASKLARLGLEAPITDYLYYAIEQTPQPG
jgi:uncharacterized damage-inducible protein DinB